MTLSEYLTEGILSKKTGVYKSEIRLRGVSFEDMLSILDKRKDIHQVSESDALIFTVTISSGEYSKAHSYIGKLKSDLLWFTMIEDEYWYIYIVRHEVSETQVYIIQWLDDSMYSPECVERLDLPAGKSRFYYDSLGDYGKIESEMIEMLKK